MKQAPQIMTDTSIIGLKPAEMTINTPKKVKRPVIIKARAVKILYNLNIKLIKSFF
nr:hypothetical protein [uncultured Chitinophaga sp.]